ncbi:hypothetical protein [Streptomyces sp. NPDC048057]|uniref:hypothetical protein n=1 Tax=Streptomyces sp. NPDC048057 TaxID=3155628 RepID=UPI0033EA4D82
MSGGPEFLDRQYESGFAQLVVYFQDRVNDSGSMSFACWTRGADRAVLYSAGGTELAAVSISAPDDRDRALAQIEEAWGTLLWVKFSTRVYG